VAPYTKILTDKGDIPISTLEDQYVNVWNGEQWSRVQVKKTGEDQELWRATFCGRLFFGLHRVS